MDRGVSLAAVLMFHSPLKPPWDRASNSRGPRHYEFPTGYNAMFTQDRFIPGEMYFNSPTQTVRFSCLGVVLTDAICHNRIRMFPGHKRSRR